MIEIYKGEMRDLLASKAVKEKPKLEIKLSPEGQVSVKNVEVKELKTMDECNQLFDKGLGGRQTRKTLMNDESSRSHLIFSITITSTHK